MRPCNAFCVFFAIEFEFIWPEIFGLIYYYTGIRNFWNSWRYSLSFRKLSLLEHRLLIILHSVLSRVECTCLHKLVSMELCPYTCIKLIGIYFSCKVWYTFLFYFYITTTIFTLFEIFWIFMNLLVFQSWDFIRIWWIIVCNLHG